ncbi:MAG: hypothetical protein V3T72_21540 [Thermoanaerobaculia bacterium]
MPCSQTLLGRVRRLANLETALEDCLFKFLRRDRILPEEAACGVADGGQLRRIAPAVPAHRKMQPDAQSQTPSGAVEVVAGDRSGDLLAAHHRAFPQTSLASRHFRRRLRTR